MSHPSSSRDGRPYILAFCLALCVVLLIAIISLGQRLVSTYRYEHRGLAATTLTAYALPPSQLYGVNASLEQYTSDEELDRVLGLIQQAGFYWVRQHFPWADIEPEPGHYQWERWDRLVSAVTKHGLGLIAVLDTSPSWARSPVDQDNRLAPPQYATTFGLFARAFATRYGDHLTYYQVWDQPNIFPHWGARAIDPNAYVRLLRVAAKELKRADADAVVLCAALAPNTETGGRNLSDVLFLRGIYRAGGRGLFDILAAKAYGFWSGPEDRRADLQVLNFSRLILLREEMVRHGDGEVPVWAVEFGWSSLPTAWQGQPSPWGTDDSAKQADRTIRAVQRARQEWGWLGVMCWAQLQPPVSADDPLWGLALLGPDSQPTALYWACQQAISAPVAPLRLDSRPFVLKLGLLGVLGLLALTLAVRLWPVSPWGRWIESLGGKYLAAPDWMQYLLLGLALAIYHFAPWSAVSLVALACGAALIWLRLDIGLAYLVFAIPFFLRSRVILGRPFSPLELLTWLCVAVRLGHICRAEAARSRLPQGMRALWSACRASLRTWTQVDWATVAFVLVSALSLFVSANRAVSIREFRVIIVEPVLLYWLLRRTYLTNEQRLRLADALLLAGVLMSLIGLHQYVSRSDVIAAEGVWRVRGVYSSPNNLSLLLGRIIPLAIAMPVVGRSRRRWIYALALLPLLVCLFLTYSRGGWLLSLPAAVLTVGLLRGRKATLLAVAIIALCAILLLPLVGTQRIASLLDTEQGTTFRRLKLWEATWAMIRDHPITGVGLDNFLYQYPYYMRPEAWQEPDLSHPHNIILDYWTRLGIAGVAVLIWLEAAFFTMALRRYKSLPDSDGRAIILGLMASMAAMLAHGLIDNSYFLVDLAFIFFFTLGWTGSGGLDARGEASSR